MLATTVVDRAGRSKLEVLLATEPLGPVPSASDVLLGTRRLETRSNVKVRDIVPGEQYLRLIPLT